jgi:hypothetical protein
MCDKTLKHIKIYSQNWKKLNPDYDIKLYDDKMCKDFLLKEYSQLYVNIFNYIPDGPIKADFWRVCVINKYGGFYIDADIDPICPLNDYIDPTDDFITCISFNFNKKYVRGQLNPHFFACNKNNIILENCIQRYVTLFINSDKFQYDYWDWSICSLLNIEGIVEKKSQILVRYNQKIKLLYEHNFAECTYNGKIVFNNRYTNYINHEFIKCV